MTNEQTSLAGHGSGGQSKLADVDVDAGDDTDDEQTDDQTQEADDDG